MTRVLLFGASGMLGSALVEPLSVRGIDVVADRHGGDIAELGYVADIIATTRPSVIINAAGVIPLRGRDVIETIRTNAVAPHVLAAAAKVYDARLVHISTDCVFKDNSATWWLRYAQDIPDATDLYGRSKALGEPGGAVVLRTSFVGPQHGLWKWLVSQPPGSEVDGWTHAMWSGSTVWAVADKIAALISNGLPPDGKYHLATGRAISKHAVLTSIAELLHIDVRVRPVAAPASNRALGPSIPALGRSMILAPFREALADFAERAAL